MDKAEKKDCYLFKIMTLGNDGVGKSTLYYTFMGEPDKNQLIFDVGYKDIVGIAGKRMVKMEMMNPPEAKKTHMINHNRKTAILLMFDVTDETSFLKGYGYNGGVKYWHEEIMSTNQKILVFLIGNLMRTKSRQREVQYQEATEFASEYGLLYREIFADDAQQVDDVVGQCAEIICDRIDNNFYGPHDVPLKWDRHGIKIVGDREIIDAGMQEGDVPTKIRLGEQEPENEEPKEKSI